MLSFAPNISWLFPEVPFHERPALAAKTGFHAIEIGFPSQADLEALKAAKDELGLQIVLLNQDVPVWDRANRGYLVDPARRDEFYRTLDDGLELAKRLEALKLMLPAGVEVEGMHHAAQRACMIENLCEASRRAEGSGVLLTIELLNPYDNPGYFLTSIKEALEIVCAVNHPLIKFQADTYHLQLMGVSLSSAIQENIEWIGRIQFADAPGRNEPGTGEIDFTSLLADIENCGYRGFIGLEYKPLIIGAATLDWVPPAMRH